MKKLIPGKLYSYKNSECDIIFMCLKYIKIFNNSMHAYKILVGTKTTNFYVPENSSRIKEVS